jgi:tetratricopeptide (TPR) repeat protein
MIFGGHALYEKFSQNQVSGGHVVVFDLAPRLVSGQVAVDMWRKRPLDGLGMGAYATRYVEQVLVTTGGNVPKELTDRRFMQAHNDPLQGLAELGLLGGLLGLAAFIFGLREVRSNEALTRWERFGIAWGLVALFVASMFGFPLHVALTSAALMVVAALATARSATEEAGGSLALALATVVVFGAGTVLAYRNVAAPIVQASYYQRLADAAFAASDPSTASSLYALAYGHDRFKPTVLYGWLRALQRAGRDAEAIALQDAHQDEGLGVDAYAVRGLALERLGKREEAAVAFKRVLTYYQPGNVNYRVAEQGLDRLEGRR